jgi:hypothetical protein
MSYLYIPFVTHCFTKTSGLGISVPQILVPLPKKSDV